jgi:integrase/recombinase XerD
MKTAYPNYQQTTTAFIEKKLTPAENEVLNKFLKDIRINASEERVNRKIRPTMLQFKDIIGNLLDWDKDVITEFLILLNDSNRTEWTKNDIKKLLRRFIRFHYKNNKMIDLIKCKSDSNAFNHERVNENTLVTKDEFNRILKVTTSLKQKAILSILFETACRPAELRLLKWNDIKLDVASITFFCGKTKKSRTIPIQDSIIHLQRYKTVFEYPEVREDDYVFPSPQSRDKSLSSGTLPILLKRLSKKAGIGRNIFPYLLRHSRLTEINQKLPIHLATKFAGHSVKQSQTYVHLSSKDLTSAMRKIWKDKKIPQEQKNKYEKELAELKKQIKAIQEVIQIQVDEKQGGFQEVPDSRALTGQEVEVYLESCPVGGCV